MNRQIPRTSWLLRFRCLERGELVGTALHDVNVWFMPNVLAGMFLVLAGNIWEYMIDGRITHA
ncbi:MAG TPA: hypothetical protein VKF39_02520 [Nitrososphaerales archaeon]|nr:hypothetical protein [Nitrososphaerales archaeon]